MKLLVAILLLGFPLWSQINLDRGACPQSGADPSQKVLMYLPASVTINGQSTTVNVPVCAAIGPSLRVTSVNGIWTLDAVVPSPAPAPKMVVEKFIIPTDHKEADYKATLKKLPAPDSVMFVFFASSYLGYDISDALQPDPKSKDLIISLPKYRPFNGDKVTVVYWTMD